jgi:uncharacterized protein YndB with AHSA1/START domain
LDEVTVEIAAPAEAVWELVTDITRMGEWSPEATGGSWRHGATGPAPGARFVGSNRHGWARWWTHCRVVECERPRRFAFAVRESAMTWGWRIDDTDAGGVRLTQWRERTPQPGIVVRTLTAMGVMGRFREDLMVDGMHRTTAAIKAHLEQPGRIG